MSIEEVERIMDETQDAIEYQRVSPPPFMSGINRTVIYFKDVQLDSDLQYKSVRCVSAANRRDAGWFFITRR